MRYTSYELTRLSVLTALALALSVTESIFFPAALFPVPGMRLGLVNVVTLIAVYLFGAVPALIIVVLRCVITFAFSGNLTGFLLSLSGGVLALFVMLLLRNTRKLSFFGVSMGGAAAHNIGQILAVCLLTRTFAVISYLPVLLIVAVVTGLAVALLSVPVYKALAALRAGGHT